jgi:hypothetical protein
MSKHDNDLRAALTGFLLGVVAVVTVMFTIVQLVNARFGKAEHGQVAHD